MSQILNLSRHASDEEAQLLTSLLIYHLVERCGGQVQFTAEEIREMRVSEAVSPVSTVSAVRRFLVKQQQAMGRRRKGRG